MVALAEGAGGKVERCREADDGPGTRTSGAAGAISVGAAATGAGRTGRTMRTGAGAGARLIVVAGCCGMTGTIVSVEAARG
jgi:hypothetical protein